jgi:hypothetical protein
MKKKHLLIFTAFLATTFISKSSFAGDDAFEQGKIIISAGYGFPNLGKSIFKVYQSYGGYSTSGFGPAHIKAEYALSDKIGLGLSVNYVSYKVEFNGTYIDNNFNTVTYKEGFKGSSLSALLRMNIHFATTEKLDPYWGFGAGYRSNSYTFYSDYAGAGSLTLSGGIPFGFETTIGMRYFFTPNIGIYTEMGIAKSLVQLGLTIKL